MKVVHLTIARNHHPNQQLGPMYKPPTTILFQLEPPPAVFWSSFMDVDTGMNMNVSNSHACRVKSVVPNSVSSQFGVRANDQIVRVGTRPILGSGRNNLINDWIKTDITRSQYGEAIVQFARPHPKSTKQFTHTSYLADIVHNASKVRYPQPYYLYRNEMVKFDDYLSRVMHSTLTMESLQKYVDDLGKVDGVDFLTVARQWVYAKTRIINQEIVHYLSEEAFKRIDDCRLNDSAITKPLHHWKTTILFLHDAVAPAMTASALKPEVHPEDSVVRDWIRILRNSSRIEIVSACSFEQLALLLEKLYRASKCFS